MEIILVLSLLLFGTILVFSIPIAHLIWMRYGRPRATIPGWKTRQEQVNGLYEGEKVSIALSEFHRAWLELIGDDISSILDKVNIYWKAEPIELGNTYTVNGKTFSKATGITRSERDIDVWIYHYHRKIVNGQEKKIMKTKEEMRISSTALVHELIHIALWSLHGDPDADHEGGVHGKTWNLEHTKLEAVVNNRLLKKGI
jgi:hypothetical protein